MKIVALKSFVSGGCKEYKKDKEYEISETLAKMFIDNKLAKEVESKKVEKVVEKKEEKVEKVEKKATTKTTTKKKGK